MRHTNASFSRPSLSRLVSEPVIFLASLVIFVRANDVSQHSLAFFGLHGNTKVSSPSSFVTSFLSKQQQEEHQQQQQYRHYQRIWTPRGGSISPSSTGRALPEDQLRLNEEAHLQEIESNALLQNSSYYHGPCEPLSEKLETIGFDVGDAVLPDFNDDFRQSQGNNLIHVTKEPLFTREECNDIIRLAEEYFDGNWTKLPSGRYEIAGSWIKDIPPVRDYFNRLLRTKIFPSLAHVFPHVVSSSGGNSDASNLCIQSAYLFKYTPESGEKTDVHMDSSLLAFTILLNDPSEFTGGGTFYETLRKEMRKNGTSAADSDAGNDDCGSYHHQYTGRVVPMHMGDITFRPAALRHRGQPITSGVRYVIGGFVTNRKRCEHTRQLLTRGLEALQNDGTAEAKQLFELARDYAPNYGETYMNLAHCLRKLFGDNEGALQAYKQAAKANPRNADSAFMVGVMYGELGKEEEAMKWYQTAVSLNEFDGDAYYRQGLILGRRGDVAGERTMYQKAVAVQPNHADAHCNLGVSYGEAGDEEKEIECYERALAIDPENEDAKNNAKAAYYYRGMNAYERGDLVGALSALKRILDGIAPDEPSVIHAYKTVHREVKEKEEAAAATSTTMSNDKK